MAKKQATSKSEHLHYANLAVMAEQAGDYENAATQWRKASGVAMRLDSIVLYEEAAKRCERKSKEHLSKACTVGN